MRCLWCNYYTTRVAGPVHTPDWRRWICSGCGCMGYYSQPTNEALSKIYDFAWIESDTDGRFASGSTSARIADSLIRLSVSKTGRLETCLDYGSGKGWLAKSLVKWGARYVYAIEPFGPDPGIEGVEWCIGRDYLPSGLKYDHVFMVEVVEHFLDPINELEMARSYLSDDGWLFITTPNARGWRARIEGPNWREAQNPTHINLFSHKGLTKLLNQAGFTKIIRLHRPVPYNATGIRAMGLCLTQMFGIDGGLRVIAR